MEFELLHTDRLILKKYTPDHLKFIFQHFSMNQIIQELGFTTKKEYWAEKERLDGGYSSYNRSMIQFKLILKNTNEVIGSCGFHNWYIDHKRAEIGYLITKDDFKMQGFMSEAVEAIIDYGFRTMGLNRIEANISPQNMPSRKIIYRLGFQKEGLLRQHYNQNGVMHDSIVFSLLKEDYFYSRQ